MALQTRRDAPGSDAGRSTSPGSWLMLAVLLLGQFMCIVDVLVTNVAMPSIAAGLHASGASLQLVVGGYTIAYAMMLICPRTRRYSRPARCPSRPAGWPASPPPACSRPRS